MKIASVNVRGLLGQLEKKEEGRSAFLDFVRTENPDVLVVCEAWLAVGEIGENSVKDGEYFIKFCENQMGEYSRYYSLKTEKRAGIVVFSKEKVDHIHRVPYWNGRFIELTITNLRLICVYVPTPSINNTFNNSKERHMFQKDLSTRLTMLKHHNKPFIVCEDFNTAPNKELDSINIHTRDRECDSTGYIDKDWYKMLADTDAVDAYRHINGDKRAYSWVAITSGGKNKALRIDHFVVSKSIEFKECYFLTDKAKRKEGWRYRPMEYFFGSDHQPIILNTENEPRGVKRQRPWTP